MKAFSSFAILAFLLLATLGCNKLERLAEGPQKPKKPRRPKTEQPSPQGGGNTGGNTGTTEPANPGGDGPAPAPPKPSNPDAYRSIRYKLDYQRDIVFGKARNIKGQEERLLMDAYLPAGAGNGVRAAVVIIHGGGFKTGTKRQPELRTMAEELAQRGYTVFSVDYRLGIETPESAKTMMEAQWRAQQDVREALQFIADHAADYKVDTDKIFLVGTSAGGVTALLATYMDIGEVPPAIDQQKWGSLKRLSGLKIAGVANLWGAINDPKWISKGDAPVLNIHTRVDNVVPLDEYEYFPGAKLYGSRPIHERAKSLGIYTDLVVYDKGGHGAGLMGPYFQQTLEKVVDFLQPLAAQ